MNRVKVVTDSTADFDEGEAARLGLEMIPLTVFWGDEGYLDKVDLSVEQFYEKLRADKRSPRTSQPSVGLFDELYRRILDEGYDSIVSVHISSKLSGTCNAARMAAEHVAPGRIAIVDSGNLAWALGALAMKIASLAAQGGSFEECIALGESLVPRLRLFAAADTLEYLRRGGRVTRAQAFAGTLLSIKPIIQLVDGEIIPADRVRTKATAIRRMGELVLALGPLEEAAVLYADEPAPANQLYDIIRGTYPDLPIARGRTGAVIGAHNGPGLYGVYALLRQ